ncbi:hypothetical protein MTKAM_01960 [Moorella thermoacetica]
MIEVYNGSTVIVLKDTSKVTFYDKVNNHIENLTVGHIIQGWY